MFKGETIMTGVNNSKFGTNGYSELKVMHTVAGYYLGTTFEEDDGCGSMPATRETEYFDNEAAALNALKHWNDGHPVKMRVLNS